jgi:hypothetical protein
MCYWQEHFCRQLKEGPAVRFMLKAAADRRQDIEQWQKEITKATAVGDFYLVIRLRSRISEAKQIIADSGY